MKYALDTSVLVRILSNRPQPLAGDVIRLVAARIGGGVQWRYPSLVLSEAYEVVAGREGCVRGVGRDSEMGTPKRGFRY